MICLRLVLQTTDIKSKYNLESRNVLKIYYILCVIYLSQSQFCIQIFTTYVAQLFLLLFLGTHQHESICVYRTATQIEECRSICVDTVLRFRHICSNSILCSKSLKNFLFKEVDAVEFFNDGLLVHKHTYLSFAIGGVQNFKPIDFC